MYSTSKTRTSETYFEQSCTQRLIQATFTGHCRSAIMNLSFSEITIRQPRIVLTV